MYLVDPKTLGTQNSDKRKILIMSYVNNVLREKVITRLSKWKKQRRKDFKKNSDSLVSVVGVESISVLSFTFHTLVKFSTIKCGCLRTSQS